MDSQKPKIALPNRIDPAALADIQAWRREQIKRQEALWLAIGATPFQVVEHLASLASQDWNEVFEEGPNGEPRLKDWNSIPWHAKAALSSISITETIVSDNGNKQVIKRNIKITRDDKLKAIAIYKDLLEMHNMDIFKQKFSEEQRKARGLSIDMRDRDHVYTLEDVDEKAEIDRMLGDD